MSENSKHNFKFTQEEFRRISIKLQNEKEMENRYPELRARREKELVDFLVRLAEVGKKSDEVKR